MTLRERILGLGVGTVIFLAGCQYLWTLYRGVIRTRQSQVEMLDRQILGSRDRLVQGAYADRMMGEYLIRSLPSDIETARSNYSRWLSELITLINLNDASIKFVNVVPVRDSSSDQAETLYQKLTFEVSGKTDQRGWIEFMHLFHSKDYLHRIIDCSAKRSREGNLDIDLKIEAISLSDAKSTSNSAGYKSPLVGSFDTYSKIILNRNMFVPPNRPPYFIGPKQLSANLGEESSLRITAEDPEGDRVALSILGAPPSKLKLDQQTGQLKWENETAGTFQFIVKAEDNGYPPESIEQTFDIVISEPPPPKSPESPTKFDDSTQTVLTALVQGGGDWTAWVKIKTLGTTLKLKPGDRFEIGSLSGSVIDVNARFATLEIGGNRFNLRPSETLSEAAKSIN
jgi:hypothetical protein